MKGTTGLMEGAAIGRGTAGALAAVFVILIGIPPVHQFVREVRGSGRWRFLSLFRERPTRESLKAFEDGLARDSDLAAKVRAPYQSFLTRALRQGNEKVVVGRNGWLFYRQEVEMVTGPGFLSRKAAPERGTEKDRAKPADPVAAIVDFHRRLRARGIHLVFVPIPVKPFIYPEEVWPGYPVSAGPAWNADRDAFLRRLGEAGVETVDVTDDLWRAKGGADLYLRNDTHWTPRGLGVAADRIAAGVRPCLEGIPREDFAIRREVVTGAGDLRRSLEVRPWAGLVPSQTVEIERILQEGGGGIRGGDDAPVLLLGDSFTNVYSRKELEWGEGAGLGEQLAARLGVRVQVIAIDGGGATAVRETVAARPSALRRKKVVVWACSARDLYDGDVTWEVVPLAEGKP